jgi:arylsulfatase A-like enzyme
VGLWRSLGVAAAALGLAACGPAPARNLILVSIDTLRADKLGAYGYERASSPALDTLAREGVLVETAVSPSPWTLPAHVSMLTGLYPSRHGVNSVVLGLPEEVATLAERLSQQGFRTAGIVNSRYLDRRYGLQRGFDEYAYVREAVDRVEPSEVADRALAWLDADRAERFFLFLHFYDVHSDYRSLEPYEREFLRSYNGWIDGTTRQLLLFRRGPFPLQAPDRRSLEDRYVAGVRQMDDGLARLLDRLEERGLHENTLLVVSSDHGEELLEHGGVLHSRTQFDEVLRVPLVLRGPGVPAGVRVAGPASLVDLVPTVLSLLGVAAAPDLDGLDLSALWARGASGALPDRAVFGEADRTNREHDMTRSVRRGGYKLILEPSTGLTALFNLEADPRESWDVQYREPARAASLRAALDAFMQREPVGEPVPLPDLTAEELEALRELGYL